MLHLFFFKANMLKIWYFSVPEIPSTDFVRIIYHTSFKLYFSFFFVGRIYSSLFVSFDEKAYSNSFVTNNQYSDSLTMENHMYEL